MGATLASLASSEDGCVVMNDESVLPGCVGRLESDSPVVRLASGVAPNEPSEFSGVLPHPSPRAAIATVIERRYPGRRMRILEY